MLPKGLHLMCLGCPRKRQPGVEQRPLGQNWANLLACEEGEKENPVGCRGWLLTGRTQSALFALGNCSALAPKGLRFPQRLTLCRHPGSTEQRCPGHCSQAATFPTQQGSMPPNVHHFGPISSLPRISRSIRNLGPPFQKLCPRSGRVSPSEDTSFSGIPLR